MSEIINKLDKYILDMPKSFNEIVEVFNEHEIYDSKFVEELNIITEVTSIFCNKLSENKILNVTKSEITSSIFMHINFTSFEQITPREIFISIVKMVEHFLDVTSSSDKIITEFKKD